MKHRKLKPKAERTRESVRRRLALETLCDRRVLAAVSGVVFDDVDGSWRQDAGETALNDRLVFVDANDNALPDDGEPFVLTDVDGSFSLSELGGDEQIVRLFAAAESQRQHFVVRPQIDPDPIEFAAAGSRVASFSRDGNSVLLLTDSAVLRVDLVDRSTVMTELPATPRAAVALDEDAWLILASDELDRHAFVLSAAGELQPIDLFAGDPSAIPPGFSGWSDLVIDDQGDGLALPRAGDEATVPLFRLVTAESGQLTAVETATEVVPGAELFGGGGITSVIAEPRDDQTFDLTLWSHATGSVIGDGAVTIDGAEAILGYSDSLNLLFVALEPAGPDSTTRSILVLDTAAQFAPLMTIDGLDETLAIDLGRGIIFSQSTTGDRLRAIDALSSATIADWRLDSPAADQPDSRLLIAPGGDQLVILMSTGAASVPLRVPDAHRIAVDGSRPLYPLRFAVRVSGENSPPQWTQPLEFTATQDTPLTLAEGMLLSAAGDADGDPFVVLRASDPLHGQAGVTPGGAMSYVPQPGFVGTDSFELILHDGRGVSAAQSVQINVVPAVIPDPEIVIDLQPLPENATVGFILGTVETIGLGDGPLIILVDDPRFEVVDQQIIVVEGAELDYEQEYQITATVTASDPTGDLTASHTFTIELLDRDDPIEDIQPRSAEVFENVAGELIAELMVIDQDAEQPFILTVDDDRFEIVNRSLRLKPGISLDYEQSSTVVIQITATDAFGGGDSMTVPFEITVIDQPEQADSITASDLSVTEFVSGDVAGMIRVDGHPLRDSYIASVDDSRFELVAGVLKLRPDHFLDRSDQQEALVVVTVQDRAQAFPAVSQALLVEVLANENPFHNPDSPYDVNADGDVTPLDALLILNALQQNGGGGPISQFPPPGRYWDVNGDGMISPLDALLILNFINQQNRPPAVGEPDLSPVPTEPPSLDPPPGGLPGSDESVLEPPLAEAEGEANFELSPPSTSRSSVVPLAVDVDAFATQLASGDTPTISTRDTQEAIDSIRQTVFATDRWRRESTRALDSWAADLQTLRRQLIARLTDNDWETLTAEADNLGRDISVRNWLPQIEAALARLNRR